MNTKSIICLALTSSGLIGCASAPPKQVSSLLMNGTQSRVVMVVQPELITVSISVNLKVQLQPEWTKLKVSASRYPSDPSGDHPVTVAYGGTNLPMKLVQTFKNGKRSETTVFELKADPSLIETLSDVLLQNGANQCRFELPLEREGILARFYSRTAPDELSRFERLRISKSAAERQQAREMVLFKLTAAELRRVGIRQQLSIPPSNPALWHIGSIDTFDADYEREQTRFHEVLRKAGCPAWIGMGSLGGISWTIDREHFFQARDALLAGKRAKVLKKTTSVATEPRFWF